MINVVKKLNSFLNIMGVEGLIFEYCISRLTANPNIAIKIYADLMNFDEKNKKTVYNTILYTFESFESIDHIFQTVSENASWNMSNIYSRILHHKKRKDNGTIWRYDLINDIGMKFLEIAATSSSIEELEFKLKIFGYLKK
jgi:hypothetical protein